MTQMVGRMMKVGPSTTSKPEVRRALGEWREASGMGSMSGGVAHASQSFHVCQYGTVAAEVGAGGELAGEEVPPKKRHKKEKNKRDTVYCCSKSGAAKRDHVDVCPVEVSSEEASSHCAKKAEVAFAWQ